MTSSTRLRRFFASIMIGGGLALTAGASAAELPKSMTWSSYDVGSAGYAEASAIADAFGKKFGTRIRIQPSGSSIGRLQPVLSKRADVGFLATETFFASEGIHDFSTRRWGPQDLRVVAGRPSSFGIFTAADADIHTLQDLKGKRFAYVAGNPSINVKCDAFLAFAGLTRDDVDAKMFPTYANAMSSLARNEADASCTTTTPSHVYELEQSPRGIRWLEVPADDEEGWKRLRAVAPFFQPYTETVGAGISKENPVDILAYRYPVLVVRSDSDADLVYAFTKALDETYDLYKDATSVMPRWDLKQAGVPAADAPFHEGAIRYLKEKGIWTDEAQAWNDARIKRLNALRDAWQKAVAEGDGKSDEEFAAIWDRIRTQALNSL
ncbi:putative TrapT family, dctP subunit, C4-dicarboxylate periplasmic binding protein [Alloalcanivorax dieselolei B5]|uniref:Putative TrapT family, dctP subunit, C4-dicarboxylate periplasmic binding protein n=1 Tax=Alcanivorax dieselolei (strain DSM 16502 / CGMCC 1.3690 / MCCC 1A00001 / B-5) TaxID=930169 RepID=K0CA98_ALCDB|nr:TAXI family TRAP transporter solute-binding subunit [Alloalcanivorax dieselolei]AFT68331.1 putative TrapT family, dctP subunit, C4-dicarboxylate periplasmic binding protein [Alloalcanivorax dieselolei B5]GGJ80331.1 C4-dicarboxylate ABC transporter [Alloalcanivorax dieselolei]